MKRCLPIFFILISTYAFGALNKWVDSEGKVHYSDEAPPSNVKSKTLTIPASLSGVPAQKSIAEREAERKKELKAKEESTQKEAKKQEAELAKQKNCAAAKSNLRSLESNVPIQTYNEQGEKNLMDTAARQQGIEDARKQISLSCD